MKIAVLHYHLRPGGVTTVIRQQIEATADKNEFLIWGYAQACFEETVTTQSFSGEWVSDSGNDFVFEQQGNIIKGQWEKEKKGERFEGTISNLSAKVTYQKLVPNVLFSLEPSWGQKCNAFAYLDESGEKMYIHVTDKDSLSFLTLTRKASN
ncbi:MAG: hypothetical protein SVO01_07350 [Thermotogota bacterium]|nr:hypothetical protein [Thermotogota bacterium]